MGRPKPTCTRFMAQKMKEWRLKDGAWGDRGEWGVMINFWNKYKKDVQNIVEPYNK